MGGIKATDHLGLPDLSITVMAQRFDMFLAKEGTRAAILVLAWADAGVGRLERWIAAN